MCFMFFWEKAYNSAEELSRVVGTPKAGDRKNGVATKSNPVNRSGSQQSLQFNKQSEFSVSSADEHEDLFCAFISLISRPKVTEVQS